MRSALWTGERTLSIVERPIPTADRGEIILRVRAAAICGTDIRMWKGTPASGGQVLGHEIAGEIYEVGEDVHRYRVGDRVAVAPNFGCGVCDQCVSGRTHLCAGYQALGVNTDGGFEEYVRIPEKAVRQGNVCSIADTLSYEEAAAVEPLSCVYNAFETYRVNPGDCVLIIGAGPIGCMHAMLALMAGASKVILNDLSEERLRYCQTLLPQVEICCKDLSNYVSSATNGRGLDVCVTACPSKAAQEASLQLMGLFGRVCFFGGLPAAAEPVSIDSNLVHYRHLTLTGTSRSSLSQYRKCLELVGNGVLPLANLITHRFTLDQICEAFDFAAAANGMKSVIVFP